MSTVNPHNQTVPVTFRDTASAEPYNHTVRAAFDCPAHAGDLTGDPDLVLRASVAEAGNGAHVELTAAIADRSRGGEITEMRFRVWGCPHLIAAAETLCKELEGRSIADLSKFDYVATMEPLAIPVEKTGRILLLEDALRALLAQYAGTAKPAISSE